MSIGRLIRVAPIALSASGCGLPLDLGWREAGVVDVPDAAVVARDTGAVVDAGRADAPSPDAPSPDSRPEDVGDGGAGMDADARDVAVDAPRPDLVAPLDCGPGAYQDGAACSCVLGHTLCGGGCFDLQTNPMHCGACGRSCGGGACALGTCECPNGLTRCDGVCVATSDSANHCGRCGASCTADQVCVEGLCRCGAGFAPCGPTCVDLQTSASHCGACGRSCRSERQCVQGECVCAAGLLTLDERCCGAPGQPCCARPGSTVPFCIDGLVCGTGSPRTCRSPR